MEMLILGDSLNGSREGRKEIERMKGRNVKEKENFFSNQLERKKREREG